jgi:DNA-binding transcriptional LysR family regulator
MRSIDLLDWDDLKVFLAVARTGNLAQTAKLLRVDHSTVSRRVAQLETALGYGVFERSRTGFRINDLGERLLARAEVIESEIIGISADVQDEVSSAAGTVKLATMEGIASLYLAPRMVHLKAFAPKLKMELITSPQVIHVNRREADLFLSFFKPSGQGLVSQKIGVFKLHLYAHPDYISSKGGAPRSEVELREYEFITYIEDLIQVDSVRWLRDVIDDATSIFNSNSMIAQMMAATGGLGVVLLPKFAVHEGSPLVPIMTETMSTTREIWLNVHQDLQFAPRIKTVVSFLKQQIDKDIRAGSL